MAEHTLHQEITNEQDRDCGVVLDTFEVQVFFEAVQACLGQSVPIEVVEEVHGPENRLTH